MDGITHISSVLSAPWIAWIMLALMVCAVFAEWFQPGVILQAPSAFFARTNRTYRESPANFQGQFLITLYRLGTVAMALFVCVCPADQASAAAYGLILAGVVAVLLVKMLVNVAVDYVFLLTHRYGEAYGPYGDLVTMVSLVLYPAVLLLVRFGTPEVARWVMGVTAALFLMLWIYRAWRTYVSSLMAPVYLLMYIATMEVLPLAGVVYLSEKIITSI